MSRLSWKSLLVLRAAFIATSMLVDAALLLFAGESLSWAERLARWTVAGIGAALAYAWLVLRQRGQLPEA